MIFNVIVKLISYSNIALCCDSQESNFIDTSNQQKVSDVVKNIEKRISENNKKNIKISSKAVKNTNPLVNGCFNLNSQEKLTSGKSKSSDNNKKLSSEPVPNGSTSQQTASASSEQRETVVSYKAYRGNGFRPLIVYPPNKYSDNNKEVSTTKSDPNGSDSQQNTSESTPQEEEDEEEEDEVDVLF